MRTYNGQLGQINVHTLPNIINWLNKNNVPYDEIIVGKPWCGFDGWYIDDKAIRPSEFLNMSQIEIKELLNKEKQYNRNLANDNNLLLMSLIVTRKNLKCLGLKMTLSLR